MSIDVKIKKHNFAKNIKFCHDWCGNVFLTKTGTYPIPRNVVFIRILKKKHFICDYPTWKSSPEPHSVIVDIKKLAWGGGIYYTYIHFKACILTVFYITFLHIIYIKYMKLRIYLFLPTLYYSYICTIYSSILCTTHTFIKYSRITLYVNNNIIITFRCLPIKFFFDDMQCYFYAMI